MWGKLQLITSVEIQPKCTRKGAETSGKKKLMTTYDNTSQTLQMMEIHPQGNNYPHNTAGRQEENCSVKK
jgi:hypothetical protein